MNLQQMLFKNAFKKSFKADKINEVLICADHESNKLTIDGKGIKSGENFHEKGKELKLSEHGEQVETFVSLLGNQVKYDKLNGAILHFNYIKNELTTVLNYTLNGEKLKETIKTKI